MAAWHRSEPHASAVAMAELGHGLPPLSPSLEVRIGARAASAITGCEEALYRVADFTTATAAKFASMP